VLRERGCVARVGSVRPDAREAPGGGNGSVAHIVGTTCKSVGADVARGALATRAAGQARLTGAGLPHGNWVRACETQFSRQQQRILEIPSHDWIISTQARHSSPFVICQSSCPQPYRKVRVGFRTNHHRTCRQRFLVRSLRAFRPTEHDAPAIEQSNLKS
jgi:hypothetical protein